MGFLLIILGVIGIILVNTLVRGFVIMKLWGWFIVPLFGLTPLTIPFALGLSLIMTAFTYHYTDTVKDDSDNQYLTVLRGPLTNLVYLLMGWVITFFL